MKLKSVFGTFGAYQLLIPKCRVWPVKLMYPCQQQLSIRNFESFAQVKALSFHISYSMM